MEILNRENILSQAYDEIIKHHRCGVNLSMGLGKTFLGLKYLNRFQNGKFLVVVPKINVETNWKTEIDKFNFQNLDITFLNYRSLHKQKNLNIYDVIVFDEAHNLLFKSHNEALKHYNNKILGLTGTPPLIDYGNKGKMKDLYYPIVYEFTVNDSIENFILNDFNIVVHLIKMSSDLNFKQITKKGNTFYTSEYKTYQWYLQKKENLEKDSSLKLGIALRKFESKTIPVKSLINKHLPKEEKVIIFCNNKKQCDQISNHRHYSGIKESGLKDFISGKITRLTCVEQINEGITIPDLKTIVIVSPFSKSSSKTIQRIGRVLRLKPDEVGNIHIFCYENTVEIEYVKYIISYFKKPVVKTYRYG